MQTARLEMRPPVMGDAQAIFDAFARDPRVTKYMDWRPCRQVSEVGEHLAASIAAIAAGKCACWVIRKVDEERLCGRIDLRIDQREGDVGYVLAASHWGQGIMPEAVRAVLEYATSIGLRRVTGTCDSENRASARVFEKCGFRYVGTAKGGLVRPALSEEPRDSECYEILLGVGDR